MLSPELSWAAELSIPDLQADVRDRLDMEEWNHEMEEDA